LLAPRLHAAETIYLIYSPFTFSVEVAALESFARTGKVPRELAPYLKDIKPEQLAEFRRALVEAPQVDPVLLSRFFKTEIGEDILTRFGNIIKVEKGRNGKYILRAALVQAAFAPEGLTLLNFLAKLPTNIQIDVKQVITLSQVINLVVSATNTFTEVIADLSAAEASRENSFNYATLPDLTQPGSSGYTYKRIQVKDTARDRAFYVDIYQPQRWRTGKTPVVIFSHGLASRPQDFQKRATYLAQHGYLVALPQHPGSDFKQIQDLIAGYSREVFDINEFINRPLDISFVIDELTRRNASEFAGRLNLESVGVAGHSFGGYTALAVAGATLNLDNLAQDCDTNAITGYLNLSLLLQCRALKLPNLKVNFRDPRVAAVLTFNPFNSSIFGQDGLAQIQIPVLIGAGNYDPATPAIFEQIRSFPWFKTEESYLLLVEGQAHLDFSILDAGITDLFESVGGLTLPPTDLIDLYGDAASLAFFEVHIANNKSFRPFLQASYLAYLSENQSFKSYLISHYSANNLARILRDFQKRVNTK
jgi:predicted dienelactone hydrolase